MGVLNNIFTKLAIIVLLLPTIHSMIVITPEYSGLDIDSSIMSVGNSSDVQEWKFRQLPNISATNPIFIKNALVIEDEGIYFILTTVSTHQDSGPFVIDLGDIELNLRDYYSSDILVTMYVLAKLGLNGVWEWAFFINPISGNNMAYAIHDWNDGILLSGYVTLLQDQANNMYESKTGFFEISSQGIVTNYIQTDFQLFQKVSIQLEDGSVIFETGLDANSPAWVENLSICYGGDVNSALMRLYPDGSIVPLFWGSGIDDGWGVVGQNVIFTAGTGSNIGDSFYKNSGCTGDEALFEQIQTFENEGVQFHKVYFKIDLSTNKCVPIFFSHQYGLMENGNFLHPIFTSYDSILGWHGAQNDGYFRYLLLNPDGSNYGEIQNITVQRTQTQLDTLGVIDTIITHSFESYENFTLINNTYARGWSHLHCHPFCVPTYAFPFVENFTNVSIDPMTPRTLPLFLCTCASFFEGNISGVAIQDLNFYNYQRFTDLGYHDHQLGGNYGASPTTNNYNNQDSGLFFTIWPQVMALDDDSIHELLSSPNSPSILFIRGALADILAPLEPTGEENSENGQAGNGENSNNQTSCEIAISIISSQRNCSIPIDNIDWDDTLDLEDEDKDGDGILDTIELSDSMTDPSDPETVDMSVISSPKVDKIHTIKVNSNESKIEIFVEYQLSYTLFAAQVGGVVYYNEDGTPISPDEYDYSLNNETELNRLERQMCDTPYVTSTDFSIKEWVENFTISSFQQSSLVWECEWVQLRTVDIFELGSITDPSTIASQRETIRYKLTLNSPFALPNVVIDIPLEPQNMRDWDIQNMVWNLVVVENGMSNSVIFHPWIETAQLTVVAPTPSNGNPNGETTEPTTNVSPQYTSGWSIIVDVKQGPIDCSGYTNSINEVNSLDDLDSIYTQNDIEYLGLTGYYEYSVNDDKVYLSCSGLKDDIEDDDLEFCLYLFYDNVLRKNDCSNGVFVSASVSDDNYEEVDIQQEIDDWEDDLNKQLDDSESNINDAFESFEETLGEILMFLLFVALVLASIVGILKKQKEKKENQFNLDEDKYYDDAESYDSFSQQFSSPMEVQDEPSSLSENNVSSEPITNGNPKLSHVIPPFEYNGEVNEDGWEICEYPRGSQNWWWKDYESQSWVEWE